MFSEQLRKLRREKKLTQIELGKLLNVSNGTIAMWETDKRQPDITTLNKIAEYFGVSVDYLMGKENRENLSFSENRTSRQKENTVRIIGRGGVVKEYKVTEEQQKAFELLLASLPKDGIDPDVDF